MSGRSGYGRSRFVGKIINLPANMMIGGLAPRVGQPGWAIRLFWRRVDEDCFCNPCPPITITRRFFSPGNVGDNNLSVNGLKVDPTINGGVTVSQTQMYYGIVFDRAIKSAQQVPPVAGDIIVLRAPNVNWTTGVDSGGVMTDITLADTDFQVLTGSGLLGGLNTGMIIDVGAGVAGTAGGVVPWGQINTLAAGANVQNVELESSIFAGSMAYIITNPAKVGGYALLFNVTRLFVSSGAPSLPSAPTPGQEYNIILPADFSILANRNIFRQNLAISAGFSASTVVNPTNNISTTFTPPTSTVTFTTDDCPPDQRDGSRTTFNAPVGGFVIAAGTGQPTLELLPTV